MGEANGVQFLKHYTLLTNMYISPKECQKQLESNYKTKWTNTFRLKAESDGDSRLGTYFRINPELKCWIPNPQSILRGRAKTCDEISNWFSFIEL